MSKHRHKLGGMLLKDMGRDAISYILFTCLKGEVLV